MPYQNILTGLLGLLSTKTAEEVRTLKHFDVLGIFPFYVILMEVVSIFELVARVQQS
jgi:hypothetical protein